MAGGKRIEWEIRIKDLATKELKRFGRSVKATTDKARTAFEKLNSKLKHFKTGLKVAFAASVFMGLRTGIQRLKEFSGAMAEVRTIMDESVISFEDANKAVSDMAMAVGASEVDVAKGLYQTLSAGVTDAAEAMIMLEGATRLATVGVASTGDAVNLLTTVFNAYGKAVTEDGVAKTSDMIQKTIQLGKTTMPELAASMGQVLPMASQLGVEFEEVAAAVAALTLSGLSTSEAVTQVTAVFTAFLKKGALAKAQFPELSNLMGANAIKTKGLAKAMQDLMAATGGNEDILVKLMGRVEGAKATMSLTGKQAETFADQLNEIGTASGDVEEGFKKVMNSIAKKMDIMAEAWAQGWREMVQNASGALEEMDVSAVQRKAEAVKSSLGGLGKVLKPVGETLVSGLATGVAAVAGSLKLLWTNITFGQGETEALNNIMAESVAALLEFHSSAEQDADTLYGIGVALRWLRGEEEEYQQALKDRTAQSRLASAAWMEMDQAVAGMTLISALGFEAESHAMITQFAAVEAAMKKLSDLGIEVAEDSDSKGVIKMYREQIEAAEAYSAALVAQYAIERGRTVEEGGMSFDAMSDSLKAVDEEYRTVSDFMKDDIKILDMEGAKTFDNKLKRVGLERDLAHELNREQRTIEQERFSAVLDLTQAEAEAAILALDAHDDIKAHDLGVLRDRIASHREANKTITDDRFERFGKAIDSEMDLKEAQVKTTERLEKKASRERVAVARKTAADTVAVWAAAGALITAEWSTRLEGLMQATASELGSFEGFAAIGTLESLVSPTARDDLNGLIMDIGAAEIALDEFMKSTGKGGDDPVVMTIKGWIANVEEFALKEAIAKDETDRLGFSVADLGNKTGIDLAQSLGTAGTALEELSAMGQGNSLLNGSGSSQLQDFISLIATAREEVAALAIVLAQDDDGMTEKDQARIDSLNMLIDQTEEANLKQQIYNDAVAHSADLWKKVEGGASSVGEVSEAMLASANVGFQNWAQSIGTVNENMQDLAEHTLENVANALTDVVMGTKDWKEAGQALAEQFMREISNMIIKQLILFTIKAATAALGFAKGGVAEGGFGEMTPLASGGVVAGGLGRALPVRGYATGGPIVSSPHIALIGEGQSNEAVVPLPDGKSIPVAMQGGGGGNTEVNIKIDAVDGQSVENLFYTKKDSLIGIMRQAHSENRAFHQTFSGR